MGKVSDLMDQILAMLYTFKEDAVKLEKLCEYIREELYEYPEDRVAIPDRYKQLIHDVADSLNAGMVCYINPKIMDKVEIPETVLDEMFLYDDEEEQEEDSEGEDEWQPFYDDIKKTRKWEKVIVIKRPEPRESYRIMENFVNSLPPGRMSNILSEAISKKKPFRHFNAIIHQSDIREEWFAFKQKQLEEYVWNNISYELTGE